MNLLYISTFLFQRKEDGIYGLPSCSDSFFQKYLDVFTEIRVLGQQVKSYLNADALVKMTDPRIAVKLIKPNTDPRDFVNDAEVRKALRKEIEQAEAILIKPASRRGMMAIQIARQLHKPYMIEMTGDIHNALRQHPNPLKRMYGSVLYSQIKHAIRDCQFGLYVSKDYLQSQFPIDGEMCGCSDVVLEKSDIEILNRRFEKIDSRLPDQRVDLALIGFYQGKMKGVDTAIRALSHLPENYHLSVLGNGTEENRQKWIAYGETFGVTGRIHFPAPLPSAEAVLHWLDTMDAFVLPTRSEGLARCVAEAMSRGCPCFATDICTMPELLPKECLHPLGDDETLARQILDVMSSKELQKKYAEINFEHAKDYDFEILRKRRNAFLHQFKEYCESVL